MSLIVATPCNCRMMVRSMPDADGSFFRMSAYSLGSLFFFNLSVTAIKHGLPVEMLYEQKLERTPLSDSSSQ